MRYVFLQVKRIERTNTVVVGRGKGVFHGGAEKNINWYLVGQCQSQFKKDL